MYSVSGTSYKDAPWTCLATRDANPSPFNTCNDNTGTNHGPAVSIYAPAWYVKSADIRATNSYRSPGIASSGTSWAAPQVAGAVARILQHYPSYTVDQVWNKLKTDAEASITESTPDFDRDPNNVNKKLLYVTEYD